MGEVFDAWLEARERDHGAMKREQAQIAWRDFLGPQGKPPWEVETKDGNRWVEELQSGDIQPGQSMFNPTQVVKHPKQDATQEVNYLSLEEAQAFLGAIDKDNSVFGKRDYALMLIHLVYSLGGTRRA